MVVPVDEGDESRFRLLEPIRQLAAEKLAARGETEAARDAHTQWYLELIVRLDERWRARRRPGIVAGRGPGAPEPAGGLRPPGRDRTDRRRATVRGRRLSARSTTTSTTSRSTTGHPGPPRSTSTMSAPRPRRCAQSRRGAPLAQGDLDGAAAWVRRGAEAIERGSHDDGLVVATAMHHVLFGGRLAVSERVPPAQRGRGAAQRRPAPPGLGAHLHAPGRRGARRRPAPRQQGAARRWR